MKLNDNKLNVRLTSTEHKSQALFDDQNTILSKVCRYLEENKGLIAEGNAVTSKIAGFLQFDLFKKLGAFMQNLMVLNLATFGAVVALQRSSSISFDRALIQEPFILEDALGRITPVHLQFISSWEAFDAVLETRFKGVNGSRKVLQKEYALQEHSTGKDIEMSRPWEQSFLPGQKINMCMIFTKTSAKGSLNIPTCPGCNKPSDKSTESTIQWYVLLLPPIFLA
jgi:hypothetical protein